MSDLKNKVVLITGAAGNLGRAAAAVYAKAGASLALADLDGEGLARTQTDLDGTTTIKGYPTDLMDQDSVNQTLARIKSELGPVDVLANIAGGFTMGPPLYETSDQDWDLMMGLNLESVFHACRAVIPHMLEKGQGSIVNVSARAATEGKARMGPYSASKAGVVSLTQTLAAEHKTDNINVNCILPGTIDTPQNRESMPEADFSLWVEPAALADVILFLSSHAARAVTGAAIPVYGKS